MYKVTFSKHNNLRLNTYSVKWHKLITSLLVHLQLLDENAQLIRVGATHTLAVKLFVCHFHTLALDVSESNWFKTSSLRPFCVQALVENMTIKGKSMECVQYVQTRIVNRLDPCEEFYKPYSNSSTSRSRRVEIL